MSTDEGDTGARAKEIRLFEERGPTSRFIYALSALKGKRLDGYLVVTVDGVRHGDVNSLIRVIYRRFPR